MRAAITTEVRVRLSPAQAARYARELLGADADRGPLIPNLLSLIESNSSDPVPVTILQLPAGIAGAYLRREGRPFIFVSSSTYPVRRRFTIAHEFGHHVLGHAPAIDTDSDLGDQSTQREIEANAFAAEFLAPANAVRAWCEAHAQEISLSTVVKLGHFFGVSAEAARYRLEAAGVLSGPGRAKALDDQIRAEEHKTLAKYLGLSDGPGRGGRDDVAAVELGGRRGPEIVTEKILRILAAGLMSEERVAELLDIDVEHVVSLLDERGLSRPTPVLETSGDDSWD